MTGTTTERPAAITTRGYQQEMLDESLRRNIIIALDTGAGKTHIALLRMKLEAEKEATKVSWFLAPTVTLCVQQRSVIEASLPVSVGYITGSMEPNQWKDCELWRKVIRTHRVMVTTPQVLLDALRHGYLRMGRDINLIVFDEAHHATSKHPYNLIMKEFYFHLPKRDAAANPEPGNVRPMIMGLTASPIYGGDTAKAFKQIESNLDCAICAPVIHRAELVNFVHRPVFQRVDYAKHDSGFSTNLASLESLVGKLNIEDDPYVKHLREQFKKPNLVRGSDEWKRLDQKMSKTLRQKDTWVHGGMTDLYQSAMHIINTLGTWAADWFVYTVIDRAKTAANPYNMMILGWKKTEKRYLLEVLKRINPTPPSFYEDDILDELSPKVMSLILCLLAQKADVEAHNEAYSGIVFVERRTDVLALAEVLQHHPLTKGVFKTGCLLGQSNGSYRHSLLDITRHMRKENQTDTLMQFRTGDKNLLICTAVAEEGIDIQACGSVIRWDLPNNMPSWVQSRGRARRQRSTYTLMFCLGGEEYEKISEWERAEREMVERYNDLTRNVVNDVEDDGEREYDLVLRVESTGAEITLDSVIPHLAHFCAVIPSTAHVDTRPLYDIYPPDLPEGWHELAPRDRAIQASAIPTLYSSTVTLPKILPIPERRFTVPQIYRTKISAHRHAASKAYHALYDNGLLNENLLPITSVIEPELDEEVKDMLLAIEKRSSTAKVTLQMNPWLPDPGSESETDAWWCSTLTIEGLAEFDFYTRREPPQWSEDDAIVLHHPSKGSIRVFITDPQQVDDMVSETIDQARSYTQTLFWSFNGSRMSWDKLDFAYLLSPRDVDPLWEERRDEALTSEDHDQTTHEDQISVRADVYGQMFYYPDDITIVKKGLLNGKSYRFVRWRTEDEPLTEEEEEELRRSQRDEDMEIPYPLLVVRPFPPRTNFLVPVPAKKAEPTAPLKESILVPERCRILLLSPRELESAFLMPSILRAVAMYSTAASLSKTVFANSPLSQMPISLLIPAISAPAAGERENYQRLETLGDAVLKYVTCIQLLAQHPLWHEGYLARKKDHTVANSRLAKANLKKEMYRWIIRDRLISKKWKPVYESTIFVEEPQPMKTDEQIDPKERKAAKTQELSTKVLADVMESIIGAFYLHGGIELGFECIKFFEFGMTWEPVSACVDQLLSRVETLENPPSQLANVEEMIGYTFTNKRLLIEALTHASYENELQTPSYERMEFLGDAVLDMIVTNYLYHAPGKKYSPGHIHLRRSAVVNALFLSYICLRTSITVESFMPQVHSEDSDDSQRPTIRIRPGTEKQEIYLYKCLLHSSPPVLEDQKNTFARFCKRRDEIKEVLGKGDIFPWAALTRLQAPKFISDIVESIIGAVYLDSRGDMTRSGAVQRVLRKLGILDTLEWIIRDNVSVLHPISQVGQWAQGVGKEVDYRIEKEKGMVSCTVLLDGREVKVKKNQIPVLSEVASAAVNGLEVGTGADALNGGGVEEQEAAPEEDMVVLKVVDMNRGKVSEGEVKFAAAEVAIRAFKLRDTYVNGEIPKKRKNPPKKKGKGKNKGKGKDGKDKDKGMDVKDKDKGMDVMPIP